MSTTFAFLFRSPPPSGAVMLYEHELAVLRPALSYTPRIGRHWLIRSGTVDPFYVRNSSWDVLLGRGTYRWTTLCPKELDDELDPGLGGGYGIDAVTVRGWRLDTARRTSLAIPDDVDFLGAVEIDANNRYQSRSLWGLLPERLRVLDDSLKVIHDPESPPDYDGPGDSAMTREVIHFFEQEGTFAKVQGEDRGLRGSFLDPASEVDEVDAEPLLFELVVEYFSLLGMDLYSRVSSFSRRSMRELRSIVTSLAVAQSPSDIAHVGVSCRRLLEAVADDLYPSRSEPHTSPDGKARDVSAPKVVNRLCAFVDDHAASGAARRVVTSRLEHVAAQVEVLNNASNASLHANVEVRPARSIATSLLVLTWDLYSLAPSPGRQDDSEALPELLSMLREVDGE